MRVEFLRAFDDNTWDTITAQVPDTLEEDAQLIAWAWKEPGIPFPGTVLIAVYDIKQGE